MHLRQSLILVALLLALALPAAVEAAPYYNSSEPGCDGSDPNVLFCDDFEDGVWFETNCDTSGGILNLANDGWCAQLSHEVPINGASQCGAGVTPFGNCAAWGGSGVRSFGGINLAYRHLKTPTCGTNGTQFCGVNEIYVRWYAKWDAGYSWGNEKNMNITNDDGDIAFADITFECGKGSPTSTGTPQIAVNYGSTNLTSVCSNQNQGNDITIQSGRWYFWEMNVRVGSSARIRLWINDCGVDGTSCGATPILRTSLTGSLPGNSNGSQIQTVWLENWTGITSSGSGPYWDQIKASTVGPIGFSGTTTPPPSAFTLVASGGAHALTGAAATLTHLPGPTLIGFVHRALLTILVVAIIAAVLYRRRRTHVD